MGMVAFTRRYMLRHAGSYAFGTAALVLTSWLSVTIPVEVAGGIDTIVQGGDPALVQQAALRTGAMGALVILIRTVSRVAYFTPGRRVEAEVKRDLFAAILRHQPSTLRRYTTGDLFSRLTTDVNMLRIWAGFGVLTVANVVVTLTLVGAQLLRVSPRLALWLILPVGAAFLIVQLLIRRLFVLIRKMQAQAGAISEEVLQTIQAMPTIHGFAAEPAFQQRFDDRNLAYEATSVERAQLRAALSPTLTLSASLSLFLLLAIGGPLAASGEVSVGELVACAALVNLLMAPLRQSSFLVSVLQQAKAAMERIDLLLDVPPDRSDLPDPRPVPTGPPSIRIRDLSWTHPGAHHSALRGVDLDLPAGSTTGLFGATGSGKSTLLRLLARLDTPPEGTITVDGVDLRALDLDRWRQQLAMAPQRPFLFSESLEDNLTLGVPDRLDPALALGALAPDVERMPEGTRTIVGEAGVRLSGGQRQRAALARALVRPHTLALLDDVLSAVDQTTEREILAQLRRNNAAATRVIVAHRPSVLLQCDQVVVLEEGRVIDVGAPAELLEHDGPFRSAWLAHDSLGAEPVSR